MVSDKSSTSAIYFAFFCQAFRIKNGGALALFLVSLFMASTSDKVKDLSFN